MRKLLFQEKTIITWLYALEKTVQKRTQIGSSVENWSALLGVIFPKQWDAGVVSGYNWGRFFFLFGGLYNSESFVSTCLIEGAFQIVIAVRIDTVLPLSSLESPRSTAMLCWSSWQVWPNLCLCRLWAVRMFGTLGHATESKVSCGGQPCLHSSRDLQTLLWSKTWTPKEEKACLLWAPFSILGSLLLLVRAKLRFSSHPAAPAAERKRELASRWPGLAL